MLKLVALLFTTPFKTPTGAAQLLYECLHLCLGAIKSGVHVRPTSAFRHCMKRQPGPAFSPRASYYAYAFQATN